MEVKPFFKKYWDISLFVGAFILTFLAGSVLVFSVDVVNNLSALLKITHLIALAGVFGMAYNAYKTKDGRVLRIIFLILFGISYFFSKSLGGILNGL